MGMVESSDDNLSLLAFEIMGRSESPPGIVVRFFCPDADGIQVGRDFSKTFDLPSFLAFMNRRELRLRATAAELLQLETGKRPRAFPPRVLSPEAIACFFEASSTALGAVQRDPVSSAQPAPAAELLQLETGKRA